MDRLYSIEVSGTDLEIVDKAVDEIERLREDNERLRERLFSKGEDNERLREDNERLRGWR